MVETAVHLVHRLADERRGNPHRPLRWTGERQRQYSERFQNGVLGIELACVSGLPMKYWPVTRELLAGDALLVISRNFSLTSDPNRRKRDRRAFVEEERDAVRSFRWKTDLLRRSRRR